jgi:hypothetical protein
MPTSASPVYVSFGDCNTPRSLPDLQADRRYLAVVLLNNQGAKGSQDLNAATHDTATRIEIMSKINYYDTGLLAKKDFRMELADQLRKCQISEVYCTLRFNSMVISKEAMIVMDSYM